MRSLLALSLATILMILILFSGVQALDSTGDTGIIRVSPHTTSGRPVGKASTMPGINMGACPGGPFSFTFDLYLLNVAAGPNRVQLFAYSGATPSDLKVLLAATPVPITAASYQYELGDTKGSLFTLSAEPFIVGGQASDPNVPAAGSNGLPGNVVNRLDASTNPHTHVSVTILLDGDTYYKIHLENLDVAHRENDFFFYFSSDCPHLDIQKYLSNTCGNPIATDVDGRPKVDIVAPKNKVTSTNPGHVVGIVDISNPTILTFSTSLQVIDTLPGDWEIGSPPWSGRSTGNVKACFYDSSAFPLTGFPFAPNWAFECVGGLDITNQVSFTGTTPETVAMYLDASVLSGVGGFGPGDHITLSIKMTFSLKGSALPSGYFHQGPNSAGVYFKNNTNVAAAIADGILSGVGAARFVAYPKKS